MADKEYIEREALLKEIDEEYMPTNWTNSEAEIQADNDYALYRNVIEAQPAADVVEVRYSEWKQVVFDDGAKSCKCCMACGMFVEPKYNYKYCPGCGAKMDGKGD